MKLPELEMKMRSRFPYYMYMESEGLPIHFDVAGVQDLTALPRAPWARTGGSATFIELLGTHQAERGLMVVEIPAGKALEVQHHLYEQFTLILQGRGMTEIWQKDGPKRSFEWGPGSLFAPPKNTYYRLINVGKTPVIYFAVSNAPRLINGIYGAFTRERNPIRDFELVFNCDYTFRDLFDEQEDYFKRTDNRVKLGRYNHSIWYTNFIPDVKEEFIENQEQKVAGGQLTGYRMAGNFPSGHISEWPVGRYHKAHFHGPGAVLTGLKGHGYVNIWPKALGIHPWQDGHADKVIHVNWGPNSIYTPPDGYFHQHMSTGKVPARHVAVYGGSGSIPLATKRGVEEGDIFLPVREGGILIDYEDEDPEVRRYFIEANAKEGVECTMPPVTYRNDGFNII